MDRKVAKANLYYGLQFDTVHPGICIDGIYNSITKEITNIIVLKQEELKSKINDGFYDDKTQDKNYAIFDVIGILEIIKLEIEQKLK